MGNHRFYALYSVKAPREHCYTFSVQDENRSVGSNSSQQSRKYTYTLKIFSYYPFCFSASLSSVSNTLWNVILITLLTSCYSQFSACQTRCKAVLLQKLTISQLVQKLTALYGTQMPIQCSQEITKGSYPESHKSRHSLHYRPACLNYYSPFYF
jgi:hypothetical protein